MKIIKASVEYLDISSDLFDQYRQFYEQISDLNSAEKFISDRINNNDSEIFLAINGKNNAGMGFVQLYPSFSSVRMKRMWILNDLFVHENFRKQGVAEALIERSKQLAEETGAISVILETHSSNINAQKLYDKTGFEKDTESYFYYINF